MKILVVSGFLGAGKTTFIKELIKRTGREIAVLENEYGDTNLDSQDIQESGELKVWEFAEGCVCCSKKDSFANTIIAVSASLDPEYLVVEPTGVGKLSNIMANIRKVSYEKIVPLKPLVVLAPVSYYENMAEYEELYKDQIAAADKVIYSKIENEDEEYKDRINAEIRKINPDAAISDTPYVTHGNSWWDEILSDTCDEADGAESGVTDEQDIIPLSAKTEQVSFRDVSLGSVSELILLLEDVLRHELGGITRAKGVVKAGGDYVRFDLADRLYAISGADESIDNQAVFIGTGPDMSKLEKRLNKAAANNTMRDASLMRRKI
ncbi:MAG: GTP-binding protein [Mogibacterium sp.]|nr:GTP-binding protein [Mogibacterium sp.]